MCVLCVLAWDRVSCIALYYDGTCISLFCPFFHSISSIVDRRWLRWHVIAISALYSLLATAAQSRRSSLRIITWRFVFSQRPPPLRISPNCLQLHDLEWETNRYVSSWPSNTRTNRNRLGYSDWTWVSALHCRLPANVLFASTTNAGRQPD